MAVIELDLDAPPVPAPSRPPIRSLRPFVLAATALLVLVLGGAAPVTPVLWRPAGFVAISQEYSRYALDGDRLYTIDSPAGQPSEITAQDLTAGTTLWRLTAPPEIRNGGDPLFTRPNVTPAGDQLLVQGSDFATSVLDAATGRLLWTSPGRIEPAGPGRGLVQQTVFRPGTDYDLRSGDAGALYWSSDGRPHTEPPLRTTVAGVDLRTGRQLWSSRVPGAVWNAPVDGGSGLLVVTYEKLIVLDLAGGAVRREQAMPAGWGDTVATVELSGDLLLVRGVGGALTGFDVATLRQRWSQSSPASSGLLEGGCAGLPCLRAGSGVGVLDPLTGRVAWQTAADTRLERRGDEVIESRSRSHRPYALRDAATGQVRVSLDSWDAPMADSSANQPLVVSRIEVSRRATAFGVLRPGRTAVQPLGEVRDVLLECVSDDRFVVCRVPGGIRAWAYRA